MHTSALRVEAEFKLANKLPRHTPPKNRDRSIESCAMLCMKKKKSVETSTDGYKDL